MMPLSHKAVALVAFATALAGSLIAFPLVLDHPAFALDASPSDGMDHRGPLPSDMVEARLAYAKTALKITDAQSPQWNAVADVLRKQAKARDARIMAMRARFDMPRGDGGAHDDGHPGQADGTVPRPSFNAIDHLEMREKMMTDRAADLEELIGAAKPLYAVLSDDQKRVANHLLMHALYGEHGDWGDHDGSEHGPR